MNNLPKMLSFKGEEKTMKILSQFYSCFLLSNVASLWKRLLLAVWLPETMRFIFRKPNCEKLWGFVCLFNSNKFSSEQQESFHVQIPNLLARRMFWSLYCLLCLHVKSDLTWQWIKTEDHYETAWSELAGPYTTWVSSKKLPPYKPPILSILSLCLKVKRYCPLELYQLLLPTLIAGRLSFSFCVRDEIKRNKSISQSLSSRSF